MSEWITYNDITCVACPTCGFTFDASHTDTDGGGYTCPICPRSVWFPDQGDGIPDATPEELAAEPRDVKADRLLRTFTAFAHQDKYPLFAFKLDGVPLVMMGLSTWEALLDD